MAKAAKKKGAEKKSAKPAKSARLAKRTKSAKVIRLPVKAKAKPAGLKDINHFIKTAGLDTTREKEIGQHIGYRYDVNLVPDYSRVTPFLRKYMEVMGWSDLNWLEDVHLGYEEGKAAVFDRNVNSWGMVSDGLKLPDKQHDSDI